MNKNESDKVKVVLTPIVSSPDGFYSYKVKMFRDSLELKIMKERHKEFLEALGIYDVELREGWHE